LLHLLRSFMLWYVNVSGRTHLLAQTYFSASYYLPLYAQAVRGYSPLKSGLFTIPFEVSLSASSAIGGILIRIFGRYLEQIWIGISLMLIGFGLVVHLDSHSTNLVITISQIIVGTGTGLSYSGPLLALQAQVSSQDNATATSTFGFIRNLATAVSVVLGGVVFQNGMESQIPYLKEALGELIAAKLSGKKAAASVMGLSGLDRVQMAVVTATYALALRRMWILFTCTAAAALVGSAFLGKKVLSKIHKSAALGLDRGDRKTSERTEMK